MLITTEAKDGANAPAKNMPATSQHLREACRRQEDLACLAVKSGAQVSRTDQGEIAQRLKAQNAAISEGLVESNNPFPEIERPDIVISSSEGIAMSASSSAHIASKENIAMTAGGSVALASQKSIFASIRERLVVFVQRFGIRLIASSGDIEIKAQSDDIEIIADQVLRLISSKKRIEIAAGQEILLHARGSYIRINGTGIEHGTQGSWAAYAASHALPQQKAVPVKGCLPGMPGPYSIRLDAYDEYWLRNFDEIEYIVKAVSGEVIKTGTLDKHGRTDRIFTEAAEELDVLVGTTGGWLVESEDAESSHPTTVTVAEHLLGEDNNHYVNREYEILS